MRNKQRNFFQVAQKRKWQEGSYRNPYFEHKKEPWHKRFFIWIICAGVIILVASFLYAPPLRIHVYFVEGTEFISAEQIETAARAELSRSHFLIVPGNHIFFLSEETLTQALFEMFRLDQLEVHRAGRTLEIRVAEKLSRAIWKTNQGFYVIDEHGVVLNEINELPADSPLIVIRSLRNEPVVAGQSVMEPDVMERILDLLLTLRQSPLQPTSLEIDSLEVHFLRVNLEDGFAVFFDPTMDTKEQYERLVNVLRAESADPSSYEYVDVRFGERVYIKNK